MGAEAEKEVRTKRRAEAERPASRRGIDPGLGIRARRPATDALVGGGAGGGGGRSEKGGEGTRWGATSEAARWRRW